MKKTCSGKNDEHGVMFKMIFAIDVLQKSQKQTKKRTLKVVEKNSRLTL